MSEVATTGGLGELGQAGPTNGGQAGTQCRPSSSEISGGCWRQDASGSGPEMPNAPRIRSQLLSEGRRFPVSTNESMATKTEACSAP